MNHQSSLLLCILALISVPLTGNGQVQRKKEAGIASPYLQPTAPRGDVLTVYRVEESSVKRLSRQLRLVNPQLNIRVAKNSLEVVASETEHAQVRGLLALLKRLPNSLVMTPQGKIIRDTRLYVVLKMPLEDVRKKVNHLRDEDLDIEYGSSVSAIAANGSPKSLSRLHANLAALSPEAELFETRGWWSTKVDGIKEFKKAAADANVELEPLRVIQTNNGRVLHIVARAERKKLEAFESKARTVDTDITFIPNSFMPALVDLPIQLGGDSAEEEEEVSLHSQLIGKYELLSKSKSGDKSFLIERGRLTSQTVMNDGKTYINGTYKIESSDPPTITIQSGDREIRGVFQFAQDDPGKLQITLRHQKKGYPEGIESKETDDVKLTLIRQESDEQHLRKLARNLRIVAASSFVSGELHLYPSAFEFVEWATSMTEEAGLREKATALTTMARKTKDQVESEKMLESAADHVAEAEVIGAKRESRRRLQAQTQATREKAANMADGIHALRLEGRKHEADALESELHGLLRAIDPAQRKAVELSRAIVDARIIGDHATADSLARKLASLEKELDSRYRTAPPAAGAPDKDLSTFFLKYVSANNALETLSEFRFDHDGVSLACDERLNAILVRGPKTKVEAVAKLLTQLDKRAPVVSFPAAISGSKSDMRGGQSDTPVTADAIRTLRRSYEDAEREADRLARVIRTLSVAKKPPTEIANLTKRLHEVVTKAFSAREKLQQAEISKARHDLNRIEDRLQRRRQISEAIINRRIEELLTSENLKWEPK